MADKYNGHVQVSHEANRNEEEKKNVASLISENPLPRFHNGAWINRDMSYLPLPLTSV